MIKKSNFQSIQKLMRNKKKTPEKKIDYLLEQTTPEMIQAAKNYSENMINYHWKFYYELAQQREKILDKLKNSILKNVTEKFNFQRWQRAVKWEYSNHPMCTNGSVSFVGQRFNYGNDINSQITGFPCLYLASDKNTALQETLGQSAPSNLGLTPKEIALSNPQSETIVSISGSLDQIIDLRDSKKLKDFVGLIAKFKLSEDVKDLAKQLGDRAEVVTTHQLLRDTLLDSNWNHRPVQYQVPANSQIFGQLVASCGVHGILYPSKLTGKDCLAVYVHNFDESACYIEFDDNQPDHRVPRKIDSSNFHVTAKNYAQIISN